MSDYTGGGLTGLYLTNPQLAVALRQQALAQPFMQQGTDVSPIRSPWQGAARLGNALVGALLYNKGNDQIQQAIASQNNATNDAMSTFRALTGGEGTAPTSDSIPAAPAPMAPSAAPAPNAALPRPLRDNNPLAISGMGPAGSDVNQQLGDSVAVYRTPEEGTRAAMALLLKKSGGKPTTINDIVDGWAPGNPKAYKATLSTLTGFDQTQPLDLTQPQIMGKILSGMGRVENGRDLPPGLVASAMAPPTAQAGNVAVDAMPPAGMPPAGAGAPVAVAGPGAPTPPQGAPGPATAMPPTGASSPNVQRALQMMQAATEMETRAPFDPRVKAIAAGLRQQAQMLAGLDTFATLPNGVQINKRSGQEFPAAAPLPAYQETAPGVYTSPGQKPVFAPQRRIVNVPGVGAVTVDPNGSPSVAVPQNPQGIAAGAAAQSQGTEAGKTAPTIKQMSDIGRNADAAILNIDQGTKALQDSTAAGISSGYFAPWLATAAAAGKSLGINLSSMGIDPKAVGDAQVAQKTLGIVAGTILQKTLGADSAITDAKIEHFIHTQPGLETDPQALQHILQWARGQFMFEHNMAMDAMQNADPNTGIIHPGWLPGFYKKAGSFGPIYDPINREVAQPQGQGPASEMPKQQAAAQPPRPPTRTEIEAEMRKRGLLK